jgi:hypothetical protein
VARALFPSFPLRFIMCFSTGFGRIVLIKILPHRRGLFDGKWRVGSAAAGPPVTHVRNGSCDTNSGRWAVFASRALSDGSVELVGVAKARGRLFTRCAVTWHPINDTNGDPSAFKCGDTITWHKAGQRSHTRVRETKEMKGDLFCHELPRPLRKVTMARRMRQSVTCALKSVQLPRQRPV